MSETVRLGGGKWISLERHRRWWETGRRPVVSMIGALVVAGWAVSGTDPDWPFRVFTVLYCCERLIEGWANRLGLVRRYAEPTS